MNENDGQLPLISVIVPVYNTEKYLDRCIKSVTEQTYKNLEIIIIDDGSTDNSAAICDDWAKNDKRIRVFHKEKNSGISSSRNMGLDVAEGSFIGFVDSDDYVTLDMFEKLYKIMADNNSDVGVCNFAYIDEKSGDWIGTGETIKNEILSGDTALKKHMGSKWHFGVLWNKLCKTEIFYDMRFPEEVTAGEDEYMVYKIFYKSKSVAVTSEVFYFHVKSSTSITEKIHSTKFNRKNFHDVMFFLRDLYKYFMNENRPDLAEHMKKSFYIVLSFALRNVNYFQYREDLSETFCRVMKEFLLSFKLGYELRAMKLALLWLRSIFKPYIKENAE